MATPTTFHPFPHLPTEIRLMIWQLTIHPRTLNVRGRPDPSNSDPAQAAQQAEAAEREASLSELDHELIHHRRQYPSPRSNSIHSSSFFDRLSTWNPPLPIGPPPPPPPILHVCRESRYVARRFCGGYKKAFRELFFKLPTRAGIDNRARLNRKDKPYLWINIELDMLDICGRPSWELFLCDHWRRIRRLKFELYGRYGGGEGQTQDRDELHWVRSSIERFKDLHLREIWVCVPCEELCADLPGEWLPEALGGRDGGLFEGWRAVECSTVDREEDGEEDMEGKTAPEGKVFVLVLRMIEETRGLGQPE